MPSNIITMEICKELLNKLFEQVKDNPFPRTIFVKISKQEMILVRQVPNVYNFVCDRITNQPIPIPDYQMVNFKMMVDISEKDVILTTEKLPKGSLVEVAKGDLTGLCGELIRYENKYHLVVRMDLFGSALVRMPAAWVRRKELVLSKKD